MFTLLYTCPNMVRAVWSCQGAARHLLLARGAGTHCSARPDDCIPHQSFYYRQPVRQSMCCVFVGRWVGVKFESDSPKCRNSEFGQVSACICFAAAHCWLCRAGLVLTVSWASLFSDATSKMPRSLSARSTAIKRAKKVSPNPIDPERSRFPSAWRR
jgi:hypothetical protein